MGHLRPLSTNGRRSIDLALRLLALHARTGTISRLTGLSYLSVRKLAQTNRMERRGPVVHLTGPAPSTLWFVWESPRTRRDAAVLMGLCLHFDAIPGRAALEGPRPLDLRWGERLCGVYERFRALSAGSPMTFDQVWLLVKEFARRTEIGLGFCPQGRGVFLLDRRKNARDRCSCCEAA